jgi:hypothetical protein
VIVFWQPLHLNVLLSARAPARLVRRFFVGPLSGPAPAACNCGGRLALRPPTTAATINPLIVIVFSPVAPTVGLLATVVLMLLATHSLVGDNPGPLLLFYRLAGA